MFEQGLRFPDKKRLAFLCSDFYQKPLMGVLVIFSTSTYAIIGTTCVESETCYEKYHEKINKKRELPHTLYFYCKKFVLFVQIPQVSVSYTFTRVRFAKLTKITNEYSEH